MTRLRTAFAVPAFATFAALCALGGCADPVAQHAALTRLSPATAGEVAVPPKQVLEQVKQVVAQPPLSLGVEAVERGVVTTGWKRYRGDWHIARYWQERSRFRIEVIPDWDEPTARSRIQVTAETEQRPTEGQSWDREPRVPRPDRAEEVLRQVVERLNASPAAAGAAAPAAAPRSK